MIIPRRDPYIWIHLAGLATVPLWLDLCLSGLAVGDPIVPPWVELMTLGWVGTVPMLWMQLQRPFYIFSIPGLAVRPDKLGADRCRLLTLQRTWFSRTLVGLSAIALFLVLYWLYQLAPIAADMTPFAAKSRSMGWLICAVSFLLANLFVQVPATVVPLLLASPETVAKTPPYESAAILRHFMVVGLRLPAVLPDLADSRGGQSAPVTPEANSDVSPPSAVSAELPDGAAVLTNSETTEPATQVPATAPTHPVAMVSELAIAATHATDDTEKVSDQSTEPLAAAAAEFAPEAEPSAEDNGRLDSRLHTESVAPDSPVAAIAIAEATAPDHPHLGAQDAITDTVKSLSEIDVEVADDALTANDLAGDENSRSATAPPAISATAAAMPEDPMPTDNLTQ